MNDAELRTALNGLPRTSASPRFTSDVLRAVRTPAPPRALWRYAAAFATASLFVIILAQALANRSEQARLRSLRAEHQRIESELQQVKAVASDVRPVVVLENDDTRFTVAVSDHQIPREQQPIIY